MPFKPDPFDPADHYRRGMERGMRAAMRKPRYLSDPRSRRPPLDWLRVLVWCVIVPLPWIVLAVLLWRTWT